ncbi:MAG: efflux RND transporter periplasmic adaptor subunit [Deltaproteobacteria bacterium]
MNRMVTAAALALAAAWLTGCTAQGPDKAGAGRTAGRPPVAVDASPAAPAEIADGIDVVGTLAARYDAEVKSEYGGTVSEVYVTEWVRVRKGQPLAKVDTREGEVTLKRAHASVELARASALEAEAAARRADREYERAVKLKEAGLVTQQALDDAATQKEAAAARTAAARAQVAAAGEDVRQAETRVSKSVIRAPFDGVVAARLVNVGEVVGEMQKVVFRVVDNRLLDLTVTVPSADMAAVRVGQAVAFATDAVPGKTFTGKVKFINPAVSEADRSVKLIAEVRNVPEVLRGGLFVKGRIETARRRGVVLVPRASLLSWDVAGKTGDLFVAEDNVARRRAVRTGSVSGDRVEIASGVAAGELVVTRGAFNVKDGDRIGVAPADGGR